MLAMRGSQRLILGDRLDSSMLRIIVVLRLVLLVCTTYAITIRIIVVVVAHLRGCGGAT
jgi:hypothetical protein